MGFRVRREEPGALEFPARFLYIAGNYSWIILLIRQIRGEVVGVHFSPASVGTTVEITGRAGRGIRRMISVLGDNDHWPANLDDDDWLPTPTDHSYDEWDDLDEVDPDQLDRITRRALKSAGRLPPGTDDR